MYLKSLTLKGFKSFASSTTLQLEPGITCIVGPNGSGKSNVVDALAWVMGEQGAKSLRGGKMEDVIFAGTSGRPPLGRAEVQLTIDNTDGALPIEYAEVTISRTMFRNGGSEYAINGNHCRLLDVQELLSDSGIGREMHVIVGQGQLDSILHATPEDRRGFIEEAAGVLKHRKRKEKALRKLESTDGNLTRLADLLSEIRRQLKPLGRQAEVARRAQTVQADVRDARARLMADDLATARTALEQELPGRVDPARAPRRGGAGPGRDPRDRGRPRGRAARGPAGAGPGAGDLVRAVRPARAAARHGRPGRRAGAQRRLAARGARGAQPRRARGRGRAGARAGGRDHRRGRRPTAPPSTAPSAHARPPSRRSPRRSAASPGCSAPPPTAARGLARLHGQVNGLRSRAAAAEEEVGRLTEARAEAVARAERAQHDFTSLESRVAGLDAGEEGLDSEHEAASSLLSDIEDRLAKTREELTAAERERSSLSARKEALELGLNRKDGAGALLAATDSVSGLLGSVAALLSVRTGYEAAVAAALGSAADAVAVRDVDAAIGAIGHLKDDDLGRAGILLGGAEVDDTAWPGLPAGAAYAMDVVECPAELRPALARLLFKVAVVDDLAAARSLVADAPDVTAVTRDGDLLGAHFAAGGSSSQPSLIEVQAAVDEAAEQLATAAHTLERLTFDASTLEREREEARRRVDVALAKLHESDATLAAVAEELGQYGSQARNARAEAERLDQAIAGGHGGPRPRPRRGWPSSSPGWPAPRTRPTRSPTPRCASSSATSPAPPARPRWRRGCRCAPPRSGRGRCTAAPTRCSRRPRPSATRGPRRSPGASSSSARAGSARRSVAAWPSCSPASRSPIASASAERTRVEQSRTGREQELREARERMRDLGRDLDELVNTVHRDEMARTQQRMRIEQLEERALEELGLDAEALVADYGPDQLVPFTGEVAEGEEAPEPVPFDREEQTKRLRTAERALAQLGRINPLALEEFSALEERHKFLTEQLEDLKSTRKDLLDIVREVDERVEQVFTEAYADVSKAFDSTFTRLFPGGEGRLVLTDPDDMLNTGIEVEARPAGKKVKRLSLLSGGERSLVAVAFLVSLFKARPSPFYILDEVEAALDDTNLGRLLEIYEELRENSQLLVITHQKRTMEVGDALYGVTMRGDGVSAVISQRLREAEPA